LPKQKILENRSGDTLYSLQVTTVAL